MLYVDESGKRWRLPKGRSRIGATGRADHRLCREVCTERNLFNLSVAPSTRCPRTTQAASPRCALSATHNRLIHDFTSYRGLLVMSGIDADAKASTSSAATMARWRCGLGGVDDLWQFGKARGVGGPWFESQVKAGVPSDAYLATGYDKKRAVLSHTSAAPVKFRVEADFTCNGDWREVTALEVKPGEKLEHKFPDAFGAYWLRVVADRDTTATATFYWE